MGIGGISPVQLIIILVIVLLIFGTKKLRNFGGDLGGAIKGFKKAVKEEDSEETEEGKADQIEDEMGDVLFSIVNLARRLHIDPEAALARTNRKFEQRVRQMEADGPLDGLRIDELEERWLRAKSGELD